MDEARKIVIDIDGISDAEKLTPKFQRAYAEMLAQLTVPGFAHVLACHEAAHLFYFTMLGMQTYEPCPAKIEYDPNTNDYGGTLAAVKLGEFPQWTPGKFSEWFTLVAKGHASGGVIARKLMPSLRDCGDLDDKARFIDLCGLINTDPNVSINSERTWQDAKTFVGEDLEHPEVLAAIEKFAEEELRPQLRIG
jgi:hypothetical protein